MESSTKFRTRFHRNQMTFEKSFCRFLNVTIFDLSSVPGEFVPFIQQWYGCVVSSRAIITSLSVRSVLASSRRASVDKEARLQTQTDCWERNKWNETKKQIVDDAKQLAVVEYIIIRQIDNFNSFSQNHSSDNPRINFRKVLFFSFDMLLFIPFICLFTRSNLL